MLQRARERSYKQSTIEAYAAPHPLSHIQSTNVKGKQHGLRSVRVLGAQRGSNLRCGQLAWILQCKLTRLRTTMSKCTFFIDAMSNTSKPMSEGRRPGVEIVWSPMKLHAQLSQQFGYDIENAAGVWACVCACACVCVCVYVLTSRAVRSSHQ